MLQQVVVSLSDGKEFGEPFSFMIDPKNSNIPIEDIVASEFPHFEVKLHHVLRLTLLQKKWEAI